jgi:hypothetical protein
VIPTATPLCSASEASDGAAALPAGAHLIPAVDESHLLGMQLILDAHDIPHALRRELTESLSTWRGYVVVDASDFDRATALVSELQVTPVPLSAWDRRSFRLFAAAAALLTLGTVLLLLLRAAA